MKNTPRHKVALIGGDARQLICASRLKESGFENVLVVKEEEMPDSNFAGIEYPNPEDKKALTRGIELAMESGAEYRTCPCNRVDERGTGIGVPSSSTLIKGNRGYFRSLPRCCSVR